MPDQRHIVIYVQKRPPSLIVKILPPPAHNLQPLFVRQAQVAAKQFLAPRKRLPARFFTLWNAFRRNSKQPIGIGREAGPYASLRSARHTRKFRATIQ